MERRLVAILAADVVGYSRLIRADEEGTIEALKALRADLIDPKIAERHGRIVKLMGDGMLAEFQSVVDAARAAVETQRALANHNSALPKDERILLRIGVNLGDVVIDGDDIHGDGVNVAARLEGLAEPGGICISGAVYDQVRDRTDYGFEDLGEQQVKNIDRPIRVWRWTASAANAAGTGTRFRAMPLPDKPTIAVLPFDNMSGDPEQEYFSDGIAEDIITDLSKISGLFVIARNTTFSYKGKATPVSEVCRDLNVGYVLEGSVRKAGNRVRVTAQLIDGTTSGHVWADRYDRDLDDIFAVQDDVTRNIVSALRVKLTASEDRRITRPGTENLDAYDCFLKGRGVFHQWTKGANAEARRYFERALELDPTYGRALAWLAQTCLRDRNFAWTDSSEESLGRRAIELARQAVSIDENLPDAHAILGVSYMWMKHHELAIEEGTRSIELEPHNPDWRCFYSMVLSFSGRAHDAIREAEYSIRLDPNARAFQVWALGFAHSVARDDDTARELLERSVGLDPNFWMAHFFLAAAYGRLGRASDARAAMDRFGEINPRLTFAWARGFFPFKEPSDLDRIISGIPSPN